MPQTTFAYKVRDSAGKVLEGTLEADNTGLVAKPAAPDGLHAHQHRGQERSQRGHEEGPAPARASAAGCH